MVKKICLFFVGIVGFGIALVFLLVLVQLPHSRSFKGKLPTRYAVQADSKLTLLAQVLPPTARDISYYLKPYARVIDANFTIGKTEFLEWAAAQGWKPVEIDYSRYVGSSPLNADMLCVEKGFDYNEKHFRKDNPEMLSSVLEVLFDENAQRCYYRFTKD